MVLVADDMRSIVDSIISSYEARIKSIESIFDSTHQLLGGFQDTLIDARHEREKINSELRGNLAKNESLRKKDFDKMMHNVLLTQEKGEIQIRSLLKNYLSEQKDITNVLRENLGKVKEALAIGEAQRIKEFQIMYATILGEQEQRKEEVVNKLRRFQEDQQEMIKRLKELLAKGRDLRIKDLKSMLAEFKNQHEERKVLRKKRKKEVQNMLSEFQREQLDAANNQQAEKKNIAERIDELNAVGRMSA